MRKLRQGVAAIVLGVLPLGTVQAAATTDHGSKPAVSGKKSLLGATANLDADCRGL